MIDIGTICVKIAGREAGRYCVVVEKTDDKGFAMVTGPKSLTGVRRRKVNIDHIEPTALKVKIAEKAGDAEVERAFSSDIMKKLGIENPTPVPKAEPNAEKK